MIQISERDEDGSPRAEADGAKKGRWVTLPHGEQELSSLLVIGSNYPKKNDPPADVRESA